MGLGDRDLGIISDSFVVSEGARVYKQSWLEFRSWSCVIGLGFVYTKHNLYVHSSILK